MTGKQENKKAQIISFMPNAEFYFNRGVIAFQKNNISLAKKYLSRAVDFCETDEDKAYTLCQLAICYQHSGDYRESIDILLKLLESIDQDFAEAHYFLANNYAFLNEFDQAKNSINHYLMVDPTGEFSDEATELLEMILDEINDF